MYGRAHFQSFVYSYDFEVLCASFQSFVYMYDREVLCAHLQSFVSVHRDGLLGSQ